MLFADVATMKTLSDEIALKYLTPSEDLDKSASELLYASLAAHLVQISIAFKEITHIGDLGKVELICKECKELDLTGNKFRLSSVAEISDSFPSLEMLNLSSNCLCSSDSVPTSKNKNTTLKTLVLNDCKLDWEGLTWLLEYFEQLETLHLSSNVLDFTSRVDSKPYANVKALHFSKNCLQGEDSLKGISDMFPGVVDLYFRGADFKKVWAEATGKYLLNVNTLSLIESNISDWCEVDSLNSLQNLKHLRIARCPAFEGLTDELRRQLLIARLPKIVTLNGGETISDKERDTSERAFIRYYMEETEKPPRYFELEAVHGRLEKLVEVKLAPKKAVSVVIKAEDKSLVHKVDVYKTVTDLKRTLEPVTGISAKKMQLYYVDKGMVGAFGPQLLTLGTKQLYTLNVRDGDEFIVEKKP